MNRTASMVAVGGLLTAAICLPLAALLHRDGVRSARWNVAAANWFNGQQNFDKGSIVSREFSWDGSDRAILEGSGHLHFRPASAWHLTIRGSEHTLDRLRISDGRIGLDRSGFFNWDNPGRLDVELSGPALQQIGVNGSGSITVDELSQAKLDISIRGNGTVFADGSVGVLNVEISGSGNARLEALSAKDASVHIAGSGDADIAPTESADVSISGSGDVRLHTSPRRMASHVSGSGHVIVVSPGESN